MGTVRKILLSHQIMIAKVVLSVTTIASLATAAPQLFGTPALPSPRGIDENQVVTSVISTLQPAIAAAVAEALRGSSLGSSPRRPTGGSGSAFAGSNATPAKYNYVYKVADDNTQTYITQAEGRVGSEGDLQLRGPNRCYRHSELLCRGAWLPGNPRETGGSCYHQTSACLCYSAWQCCSWS